MQNKCDLEVFYTNEDPWDYEKNPDDLRRKSEALAILPINKYKRVLDVGCGNGFLTFDLPGDEIIGIDISEAAVTWANKRKLFNSSKSFSFMQKSIFDLSAAELGQFDLVVITGLLYPQYIGNSSFYIREKINQLLSKGGILMTCHISDWMNWQFPFCRIDSTYYPYRDFHHKLDIYLKT